MKTNPTSTLIEQLRRHILANDGSGLTDGQLLTAFIEQREDAAFAAIVKRHGSMVWGVCRRHLNHQDAEDAFQATFLVLVRKAASVLPREMLVNWLYGVASTTGAPGKGGNCQAGYEGKAGDGDARTQSHAARTLA